MRKQVLRWVLLALAIVVLLTACAKEPEMSEVEQFYREFMEVTMEDPEYALRNYYHYEDYRHLGWALESTGNKTLSYEIRNVEQLSDRLWAITVFEIQTLEPEGLEFVNFVGIIDGEYYVMANIEQIPPEMKAEVENIEDYTIPLETIAPEDVIR